MKPVSVSHRTTRGRDFALWCLVVLLLGTFAVACSEDPDGTAIQVPTPDPEPDDNLNPDPEPTMDCGDGVCDPGEDTECPEDCPDIPECGDGTCDEGEESICPEDCDTGNCDCEEDQVCVTNEEVSEICFDRDCGEDDQCDANEVCSGGVCVSESCAGIDCGPYPNICRAGECTVGNCSDPDVRCPDGQECVNDACLTPCLEQTDCGNLACLNGHCQPCDVSSDCGEDLVCVGEICDVACTEELDRCTLEEVCNPENGLCEAPCSPGECELGQVCDGLLGLCVDGECGETDENDCPEGFVCREHVCVNADPVAILGLCSGCARMESSFHFAIGVVAPVEQVGETATSDNHVHQSGVIQSSVND